MALENKKAPSDPEARGNTSMAASSSTTRTNPPLPHKAEERQRPRSNTQAGTAPKSPLKADRDDENISDALITDPLHELFGIRQ